MINYYSPWDRGDYTLRFPLVQLGLLNLQPFSWTYKYLEGVYPEHSIYFACLTILSLVLLIYIILLLFISHHTNLSRLIFKQRTSTSKLYFCWGLIPLSSTYFITRSAHMLASLWSFWHCCWRKLEILGALLSFCHISHFFFFFLLLSFFGSLWFVFSYSLSSPNKGV